MKIEIGYDRKNLKYVAYNATYCIVATGICVESAVKKFKSKLKGKIEEHQLIVEMADHILNTKTE